MSRFTRRIALVVAGAGVVAGAAVGVAQAAAPDARVRPEEDALTVAGGRGQHG